MSVMASALIACDECHHERGHHGNPRKRTVPTTHSAQHECIQRAQAQTLHHSHLMHTHTLVSAAHIHSNSRCAASSRHLFKLTLRNKQKKIKRYAVVPHLLRHGIDTRQVHANGHGCNSGRRCVWWLGAGACSHPLG
jgi:hypothetical protein